MPELPKIQVRVDGGTVAWLADRAERMESGTSADVQARTELALWRMVLDAELRRQRWSCAELCFIADVVAGSTILPTIGHVLFAEVGDVLRLDGADKWNDKWGVDARSVLRRLASLSPTADHALHDAISRWWHADGEATPDGWRVVGLVVTD